MKTGQLKVKIISNQQLAGYGHLVFAAGGIAQQARPGQFVNIRVSDGLEPFLRRPLSIHQVKDSRVEILYEIVGKGTQILSTRQPGEFLDVIGPLGNGFNYSAGGLKAHGGQSIMIAGGMGVAPLVFLAQKLKTSRPLVLIGGRSKKQLLCLKEFKALGCSVRLATEDGSVGFKGRVTDLLKLVLQEKPAASLFSCGPHPMLKAVAQIAQEHNIPAQLSLEEHMACGIGACLGCVVATKSGYRSVCKDGPVFRGYELTW